MDKLIWAALALLVLANGWWLWDGGAVGWLSLAQDLLLVAGSVFAARWWLAGQAKALADHLVQGERVDLSATLPQPRSGVFRP